MSEFVYNSVYICKSFNDLFYLEQNVKLLIFDFLLKNGFYKYSNHDDIQYLREIFINKNYLFHEATNRIFLVNERRFYDLDTKELNSIFNSFYKVATKIDNFDIQNFIDLKDSIFSDKFFNSSEFSILDTNRNQIYRYFRYIFLEYFNQNVLYGSTEKLYYTLLDEEFIFLFNNEIFEFLCKYDYIKRS